MHDLVIDVGQTGTRARYVGSVVHSDRQAVPLAGPEAVDALVSHLSALADFPSRAGARVLAGVSGIVDDGTAVALALRRALDASEVIVASDRVTGYLASLGTDVPGIAVTAGTGTVALGVDDVSAITMGGAGWAVDDDGGGFWIGRQGLRAAARAIEGRGPVTVLSERASTRFGPLGGWASAIHRDGRPVSRVAQFTIDVTAAAESGDPVAREIWARAADELFSLITGVARAMTRPPLRIAVIGGVVKAGETLLKPLRERAAAAGLPAIETPETAALDGAARLPEAVPITAFAPLIWTSEET